MAYQNVPNQPGIKYNSVSRTYLVYRVVKGKEQYQGKIKSLMGLVNKKFGKGTLKRATEVDRPIYAQTFDDIESFRGKIDDNIIEEIYAMDPPQQLKAIESVKEYLQNMKNLRQGQMLEGFDVTGRLSNASGGLARILEV